MKVLLIMPFNKDLIHAVSLPLGILSIATYLNSRGHEARIRDMSVHHLNLRKEFEEFQPDIIGISLCSNRHIDGAIYVSKKLKKYGRPIVWGGPFCDVSDPSLLLKSGWPDYISFSEGEATWLDIADRLAANRSLEDCPGIAYLKDGETVCTQTREFLDLTTLPELDFKLIDVPAYRQYLYGCNNLVYVYLSKGCPAKCTFCTNMLSHRCQYRRRSLEKFMHETEILVHEYGVNGLYFSDELCFLNKDQLYEVCNAFDNSGLKFHWGFQTRIGILGEAEFKRAFDSGCRWIDFGIESGSKEQLRIMKKGIPYNLIEPTFLWCEKIGIISLANFIIGLPFETEKQLRETVDLAQRLHCTQSSFLKFCISPNTVMGKEAIAAGLMRRHPFKKLTDYKRLDFFLSRTDNYSYIPKKDLSVVQSYFLWKAIFRKKYGDTSETHTFDLLFKHILTVLRRLSFLNLRNKIEVFAEISFLFLRFAFDVAFQKKTQRKYGLIGK